MQPPRKIITRSPHRRVGYVPCPWLQPSPIAYESLLECSFIRIALLCPGIQNIRHQPFRLDLGSYGTYTPDYLLKCGSLQNIVVEVKPSRFVAEYREEFCAARDVLHARGCQFLVCSELELCKDDRHERAGQILRYARSALFPGDVTRLLNGIRSVAFPISAKALAHRLDVPLGHVMYLIGRRYLQVGPDLWTDQVYNPRTKDKSDVDISIGTWLGCANW